MSKEVHLYMAGNDPFVMPVGDTVFYIHTGLPGETDPQPDTPDKPDAPDEPGGGTVLVPVKIPGLYADFAKAPSTADQLRTYIEGLDEERGTIGLALTEEGEAGTRGEQLASIIEGVGTSGRADLTVHVVPAEGAGGGV